MDLCPQSCVPYCGILQAVEVGPNQVQEGRGGRSQLDDFGESLCQKHVKTLCIDYSQTTLLLKLARLHLIPDLVGLLYEPLFSRNADLATQGILANLVWC